MNEYFFCLQEIPQRFVKLICPEFDTCLETVKEHASISLAASQSRYQFMETVCELLQVSGFI